jgi:alpha-tubulin suppressor-like RCC1 family protein
MESDMLFMLALLQEAANASAATGRGLGLIGAGPSSSWNLRPLMVLGGLYFKEIGAGFTHTCGRTSAGKAYCWGDNQLGTIGDGTTIGRFEPRAVVGPM